LHIRYVSTAKRRKIETVRSYTSAQSEKKPLGIATYVLALNWRSMTHGILSFWS